MLGQFGRCRGSQRWRRIENNNAVRMSLRQPVQNIRRAAAGDIFAIGIRPAACGQNPEIADIRSQNVIFDMAIRVSQSIHKSGRSGNPQNIRQAGFCKVRVDQQDFQILLGRQSDGQIDSAIGFPFVRMRRGDQDTAGSRSARLARGPDHLTLHNTEFFQQSSDFAVGVNQTLIAQMLTVNRE